MKNINFGIVADQVIGQCDFCGEKNKNCFKAPFRRSHTSIKMDTKFFPGSLFEKPREEVIDTRFLDEEEAQMTICKDCAR